MSITAGVAAILGLLGLASTAMSIGGSFGSQAWSQKFNADEAEKQRNWASAENEIARNFEKDMSSTAFQRQVADMKAAGLNPGAIGSGSGASTPSAPVASGNMASSNALNVGSGAGNFLSSIASQAAIHMIKNDPNNFAAAVKRVTKSMSYSSAGELQGQTITETYE